MPVSIIIPVYNAEFFIEAAVHSALSHTFTGEVILVEDYSNDNSYEVCKKLHRENDKIKLYRTEGGKNRGAGAARNTGLYKAKFEWIMFFDADDVFIENSLETIQLENIPSDAIFFYIQIRLLKSSQKISAGYFTFEEGETIPNLPLIPNVKYSLIDFLKGSSPSIIATLFHRRILKKVGYFDENLRQGEDTDFLLRLFWHSKVFFSGLQQPIAFYQIHNTNSVFHLKDMLHENTFKNLKWLVLCIYNKLPLEVFFIFYKRYLGIHPLIYTKFYIPKRIKQLYLTLCLPFKILLYFFQNKEKIKTTLNKNA